MKHRVAVVGGGPSGACAAEILAECDDVEVTLFERKMDNAKPCGGAIPLCMIGEFNLPEDIVDRKVRKDLCSVVDAAYGGKIVWHSSTLRMLEIPHHLKKKWIKAHLVLDTSVFSEPTIWSICTESSSNSNGRASYEHQCIVNNTLI